MKKALLFIPLFLIYTVSFISAQSSIHSIIGESYKLSGGIHSGIFDSNHAGNYPMNIGVVLQYNYYPDIRNNLFFGGELGSFFAFSDTDKYGRKTRDVFIDFSFYPGISFPLEKNGQTFKNPKKLIKYYKEVRRLDVSLGFIAVFPTRKRSEGGGVNNTTIKPSIGFSLRASYELKNRISIFFNTSRINRDLDGYGVIGTNPNKFNKNSVTYIHKIGMIYTFIRK